MAVYIEGQFRGQDAPGFHEGQTYQLTVEQQWRGRVTIVATHGYHFKPISGMSYTYKDLGDFLADWKVLRVAPPGGATWRGGPGQAAMV
jgi:hypothetical protein